MHNSLTHGNTAITMKQSTSDIEIKGPFKAHGQADYEVHGRVVHVQAMGPFNAELVPAISQTIGKLIGPLAESGNWAQIITFRKSALCSPVSLQEFAASLKARYTNPATNPVVALVMAPEVEGAHIMPAMICKCYGDAGVECRAFTSRDDAQQWVESQLA
ncbi:MAG: hypothetical protein H7Y28_06160 [Rhodoferax sp.]|nr:hypothetical protein [Rhodoferax sp.]